MKTIIKKQLKENITPSPLNTKTLSIIKEYKSSIEKKINYKCDCNIGVNKKHKENCIYNLV